MYYRRREGFTIIEVLTVIAIIGILAALIFPAIGTARMRAKQTQCMSNMYNIFTAIKSFQLDEHRYPDFIAGPVQYDSSNKVIPLERNTGMGTLGPGISGDRMVALYPEYIKSISALKCPLSTLNAGGVEYATSSISDDPMFAYSPPAPYIPKSDRSKTQYQVYLYSSYDCQQPKGFPLEAHYSNLWYYVADPTDPSTPQAYERQLWWRTPPEDTMVTWCSFHRGSASNPASKDLVLFLDGRVKPMPSGPMMDWTIAWMVPAPS